MNATMQDARFVREGLYRIEPAGADSPRATLLGSRCGRCGHVDFPPAGACLSCRTEDVHPIDLGSEGTLFCETTVHLPTPRFAAGHPVGYVTLPSGVRVFAPLRRVEGRPFEIGMRMSMELVPLWHEEGHDVYAHRFFPAAARSALE